MCHTSSHPKTLLLGTGLSTTGLQHIKAQVIPHSSHFLHLLPPSSSPEARPAARPHTMQTALRAVVATPAALRRPASVQRRVAVAAPARAQAVVSGGSSLQEQKARVSEGMAMAALAW